MAERVQVLVRGLVQGVGFRPFVHGLARGLGLGGYVTNTSEGVLIEVEGSACAAFLERLRSEAPPLSMIADVSTTPLPPVGYADFTIRASVEASGPAPFTLVSPDVSICHDCLGELLDPADRRHRYPLINCTNCGPRYSITKSVPYDRPATTMAPFVMCPECEREYHDPADRRFHAQPNACPRCGPHLRFVARGLGPEGVSPEGIAPQGERSHGGVAGRGDDPEGIAPQDVSPGGGDEAALDACARLLRRGGIVAIKGIGGFHLACDATDEGAVRRLRERKRKSGKPFAVMCPDTASVSALCLLSEEEERTLGSARRPIVLLRKREPFPLSTALAPANDRLGCMLPYTPLHYLLFHEPPGPADVGADETEEPGAAASRRPGARASGKRDEGAPAKPAGRAPRFSALVMTSGNLAEEPIVSSDEEALGRLSGIADGFLLHDRAIFMRVDDSVLKLRPRGAGLAFVRRSRGYAPDPIALSGDGPETLGCGADLKNTFTLTKGGYAIVSQHIGDMENYETQVFFEECLANLRSVYRVEPVAVAYDLHPAYLSTRWALGYVERSGGALRAFPVQHHYAHVASVMAEHDLRGKVIGVALDGTGYGTDGKLWGGEFLLGDVEGFERLGHFKYIALPGGEAAIREPWRTAASLIADLSGDRAMDLLGRVGFVERYGRSELAHVLAVGRAREFSPLSSGAGRLFDAVAALLGICDRNSFEGEAAMALETLAAIGGQAAKGSVAAKSVAVANSGVAAKSGVAASGGLAANSGEVEAMATGLGVEGYPVEFVRGEGPATIDFAPAIAAIVEELAGRVPAATIALRFHETVAQAVGRMVLESASRLGIGTVALSGGVFQNSILLERTVGLLRADGMDAHVNEKVPCNDACVSLGQAWLAREWMGRNP